MKRIRTPKEDVILTRTNLRSTRGLFKYLTHEEITGKKSSTAQLNVLIGKLNAYQSLRLASILNNTFSNGLNDQFISRLDLQARLAQELLDDELRSQLNSSRWGTSAQDTVLFFRAQLLYMTSLILRQSSHDESSLQGAKATHAFGKACLIVNELFDRQAATKLSPHTDSTTRRFDAIAKTLPTLDTDTDSVSRNVIARAWQWWQEIPNETQFKAEIDRKSIPHIDLEREFYAFCGVKLRDFLLVIITIWISVSRAHPSDAESLNLLEFQPRETFRELSVSLSDVDKVLDLISLPMDEYGDKLNSEPRQAAMWDWTLLRQYPLVRTPHDTYIAFDLHFLLKRLIEFPYWTLQSIDKFDSYFGVLFARYLEICMERLAVPSGIGMSLSLNRTYCGPMTLDKNGKRLEEEMCDALLDWNDNLMLCEFKGSLLSTQAKYSGHPDPLKKDVDSKFGSSKGAVQIAKRINKLAQGFRPQIPNFKFSTVKDIWPILVAHDTAITTAGLALYLNEVFLDKLDALPSDFPRVHRLIVMAPQEVESLEAITRSVSLPALLSQYEHFHQKLIAQNQLLFCSFHVFLLSEYSHLLQTGDVLSGEAFLRASAELRAWASPAVSSKQLENVK